jgi:hypothetical protein
MFQENGRAGSPGACWENGGIRIAHGIPLAEHPASSYAGVGTTPKHRGATGEDPTFLVAAIHIYGVVSLRV